MDEGQVKAVKNRRPEKKTFNPVIPSALTWKCVECDFILGYTDSTREELRMKHKDHYVTITRAEKVECTCRRCGKLNSVTSSPRG